MSIRTITFRESYSFEELAKELMDAGAPGGATLDSIASGRPEWMDDADEAVELECVVDEDDVIYALGDDAIVRAYRDLDESSASAWDVEYAVRYVRAGNLALARAMFERVFDGGNMAAVDRALS